IDHETGIAHSSTGQAVVERDNHTLKYYLARQKQDGHNDIFSLNKFLFTLNYLSLCEDREEPAVVIHHTIIEEGQPQAIPGLYVYHKNMQTGIWEGP
ncbi:POK6 protein, partial [Bombycilla garrulus]|nr:POK6 protein [Bombycilla garrulus]